MRDVSSARWMLCALAITGCASSAATPSNGGSSGPDSAASSGGAYAEQLRGIDHDTGACVVAADFDAALGWARAFRLSAEQSPSKGAEVPAMTIELVDAPSRGGAPVRVYEQVLDHKLAAKRELRRFVFTETSASRVVGCAIGERVVESAQPVERSRLRVESLSDGYFEVTSQPLPDARGMVSFAGAYDRHVCTVRDGAMGCVSLHGPFELRLDGPRLRYEEGRFSIGARRGPFVIDVVPGMSVLIAQDRPALGTPVAGRAMAGGFSRRDVGGARTSTIDPRSLSPFDDQGACVTVTARTKQGAARIEDPTPGYWAEAFDPAGTSLHPSKIGELVDGYPVELYGSMMGLGGRPFVFVAEPGHIAGCVLSKDDASYSMVEDSFVRIDVDRFSFSARTSGPSVLDEKRLVICRLQNHRLGCVSAPIEWGMGSVLSGSKLDAATVTTNTDGIVWTHDRKPGVSLDIVPGKVRSIPPQTKSGAARPEEIDARSTLKPP